MEVRRAIASTRSSTEPAIATAPRRDRRLDVWRGLCLIDVVLVHLAFNEIGFPEPLDSLIKQYTRFAAGGFVFLAGWTVATVFGSVAQRPLALRWPAYRKLWKRALVLFLVDGAAAGVYQALNFVRPHPDDPVSSPLRALIDVLALQRPGVTGGILVFYAMMLALVPAVLEARRRWGDAVLAFGSLAIYAAAVRSGDRLLTPGFDFPIAFWQAPFFAGFLFAGWAPWIVDRGFARRQAWAAISTALFAAVFVAAHGGDLDLPLRAEGFSALFAKTPLMPGALLWYLAAIQVVLAWSTLAWRPIFATSILSDAIALLGRNSLLVYVAHVFTEIPVLEWVWTSDPSSTARVIAAAIDVGSLALLALAVERDFAARAVQWAASRLRTERGGRLGWPVTQAPAVAISIVLLVPILRRGAGAPGAGSEYGPDAVECAASPDGSGAGASYESAWRA